MADSYSIIDGQVVPFSGGRKNHNTDSWRDATPLELQLQEELQQSEGLNDTLRAQLEAAEAECRTRREDYATLTELWKSDEARYVSRAEAAEADAQRYRWLRQSGVEYQHLSIFDSRGILDPQALDAAIDAALTKEQQA